MGLGFKELILGVKRKLRNALAFNCGYKLGGRVIFEILRYDEGFMKHILFSIVILQNNSLRGR